MNSWIFYTFSSNSRLLIFMLKLLQLWSVLAGWLLHFCNMPTLLFLEQFLTFWYTRMFLTHLVYSLLWPTVETVISPRRPASFYQRMVSDRKSHELVGHSETTLQLSMTGMASPGGCTWSTSIFLWNYGRHIRDFTFVWWDFSLRHLSATNMSKSQGAWAHLDTEPFIPPLRGRMNYLVILKEGTKFPQPLQGSFFSTCLTKEQAQQSLMLSGGSGVGTVGSHLGLEDEEAPCGCAARSCQLCIHAFVCSLGNKYIFTSCTSCSRHW